MLVKAGDAGWTVGDPALRVALARRPEVTQVTSVAHSKRRDWRRAHGLRAGRPGSGERRKDAVSTYRSTGHWAGLVSLRGSLAPTAED